MCFYWPITHQLTVVSTRLRTSELAAQLHGSEVIAILVLYRIFDPMVTLLEQHDIFSMLNDRTQAHLAASYSSRSLNETICAGVYDALKVELEPFGIDIIKVNVAQRGSVIPIKMLNDYAQHAYPTLADEKNPNEAAA